MSFDESDIGCFIPVFGSGGFTPGAPVSTQNQKE
jgi:hypothetical protein